MKKLVVFGSIAMTLFGISAGISWYLQEAKLKQEQEAVAAAEGHEGMNADTNGKNHGEAMAEHGGSGSRPRASVKAPYVDGAQEAAQMANSYRERINSVKQREDLLNQRQKQLDMIIKDIRDERNALDELRKQIADELKAVEERMTAVEKKSSEIEQKKLKITDEAKEFESHLIELETMEHGQLKKTAELIGNMAPEQAAKDLEKMAELGKMNMVAKILYLTPPRQASKLMTELSDPGLASQLLEKMNSVKFTGTEPNAKKK